MQSLLGHLYRVHQGPVLPPWEHKGLKQHKVPPGSYRVCVGLSMPVTSFCSKISIMQAAMAGLWHQGKLLETTWNPCPWLGPNPTSPWSLKGDGPLKTTVHLLSPRPGSLH